jgi:aminopeptidase N
MRWYAQAGTPDLSISDEYDPDTRQYRLTLRQHTDPSPGQPEKQPVPIPVAMGLLGPNGGELPTRLAGEAEAVDGTRTLLLDGAEQTFVFEDVPSPPVPSLLRGYSAPVKLSGVSRDRLRFLAAHDSDPFVRWDSLQSYATSLILRQIESGPTPLDTGLLDAFAAALAHPDPAFAAEALLLPSDSYVADQMAVADPDAIHAVRQSMRQAIGARLAGPLRATYERLTDTSPYRPDGPAIGRRALRNVCLAYLATGDDGVALARAQFDAQANMTDVLAALDAATDTQHRLDALAAFHAKWRKDDLVLDKWFSIQAMSPRAGTLADVRMLYTHPDFDLRNPNRFRSLVGAFSAGNPVRFHDATGAGYRFLADAIISLDKMNSQTAARLTNPLGAWRRQNAARQALMRAELERILAAPKLSRGTFEKASKALA